MANAHLEALSARHARLESQIVAEHSRPQPDSALIARLKREKLRLKEEMQRIH